LPSGSPAAQPVSYDSIFQHGIIPTGVF